MVEVRTNTRSIRGRYVPKTLNALNPVFASQIRSKAEAVAEAKAAVGAAGGGGGGKKKRKGKKGKNRRG